MRIALVIERMDTARGGRETSTAQIASGLAARGHDVTVLCERGRLDHPSVKVRELGADGITRAARLRSLMARVAACAPEYDIVHATMPVPGANVYQPRGGTVPAQQAASVRRRRGPAGKALAAIGGRLHLRRRSAARAERQVMADQHVMCLAVSEMVRREFETCYGRRHNVRTIFNAVQTPPPDTPQRQDWRQRVRYDCGMSQSDRAFLCVATNFELKGVSELIYAFSRWIHSGNAGGNDRLIIVGREEPAGYVRQAQMRDVGDRVVFVGPTSEVFRYYAAADVLVLLSWYDPCSRAVLEAACWGIPSITTAYNGAAEAIGGAGIVAPSPRHTREIVSAMTQLADPSRRRQAADACLALAPRFSMERHVADLEEAYADAIASR
jgi:UDP-glucose:(heptosyl)LPS alpha-1,3-glucosyltransferase